MQKIDVKLLLEKGAYFGHKISRTHPKALPYTYKAQNGIYVIDLFKTKAQIEQVMNLLFTAGKNGEKLLIVGTKRAASVFLKDYCEKNKLMCIAEKWVGGFFTNFEEVAKNIKKMNDWLEEKNSGGWDKLLKPERIKKEKKLNKLLKIYGLVADIKKVPENVLIVDVKKEKNALSEATKIKKQQKLKDLRPIQIIGLVDTNADPLSVDYPIVVNDDSAPALEYVLQSLLSAYLEGLKEYKPAKEKSVKNNHDQSNKN